MFVSARYNTGRTLCAAARANTVSAGDGFWRPAANHVSSSAIQKSVSSCIAIASVSVIMMPFSTTYGRLCASRYSVMSVFVDGAGVFVIVSFMVSGSKSRSWNIGVNVGVVLSEPMISKSSGSGNSFADCGAGVGDCGCCVSWGWLELRDDVIGRVKLLRAWMNGMRSSDGKLRGNSFAGCSEIWGSGGADSDFCGCGVVSVAGTGCSHLGRLILNSGADRRQTMTVLAIYIGTMARIKIPNTNPGKPRRWA